MTAPPPMASSISSGAGRDLRLARTRGSRSDCGPQTSRCITAPLKFGRGTSPRLRSTCGARTLTGKRATDATSGQWPWCNASHTDGPGPKHRRARWTSASAAEEEQVAGRPDSRRRLHRRAAVQLLRQGQPPSGRRRSRRRCRPHSRSGVSRADAAAQAVADTRPAALGAARLRVPAWPLHSVHPLSQEIHLRHGDTSDASAQADLEKHLGSHPPAVLWTLPVI